MKRNILESYLNKINNNHMDDLLSGYEVITYTDPKDIEIGLLRFKTVPKGKAFVFKLPKEEIAEFHTINMFFSVDIYFFNKDKKIIISYKSVPPGMDNISSKKLCKFVVEIPKRNQEAKYDM